MKRILYFAFIFLTVLNLYLSAYPVISGEVKFINDVGRDFLLLEELDQKKIVLIGPRSSTTGLFHGPLLTYLNYPSYLLGGGNPVVVGWFWVILGIFSTIGSFFIVRKLFGTLAGCFYALLFSVKMVPHIYSVFEPEAMYFVMPFFLFTIVKYVQTKKNIFLATHLLLISVFIHLSIGIGLQFLILSSVVVLFQIFKSRKWRHLFSFIIVPIFTANFIIFDLRHNFMMTKALFLTGESSNFFISLSEWINNRITNTIHMQLIEESTRFIPLLAIIFISVVLFTVLTVKNNKKQRYIYIILSFYYFGYIALSYFNKGVLLFHYTYLLFPLSLFWLVSFLKGKYKVLFIIFLISLYVINLNFALSFKNNLPYFIGRNPYSWVGLEKVAEYIIEKQGGKEFGYFVFSPDSFAYQPRYAMLYKFKNIGASEYVKKHTTYIIAQGAPLNDPLMDYRWWVKVPVGIDKKPETVKKFPNGYTVLKYSLTAEEQKIPHDKAIELGIHFR